ncbi:MAG: MlaD family protein [Myxococcota bacterium]|nr:MlaD family protein [Myxococcota bacterium]
MSDIKTDALPVPIIHRRKRGRPSAVWLVPIIAVVAAGALAVRTFLAAGPTIYISFDTAEGLEAGKSEVRYKNVPVGIVTEVDLLPDHRISAKVKLTRGGRLVAVGDSRFWVVRPQVGLGGVSGLGTLLSGAYIGVEVGVDSEETDTFVGLEKPPAVTRGRQGTRFKLTAREAGSLAAQLPVYLRRQNVGTITALELTPDGRGIALEIFVDAPYDKNVTTETMFWNASGIDVTLDATGLRVNTQSLTTVVAGGIAFGARDPDMPGLPAREDTTFELFEDRSRALAKPDTVSIPLAMRFHQPIRGLGKGVGVNVELEGLHIGDVTSVNAGYDTTTRAFYFDVNATVFPARLGSAYTTLVEEGARTGKTGLEMLQEFVKRGLRAQLRSGSLLTGSFFVALDWFPNDRHIASDPPPQPGVWFVPTVRGGTEQIQDQLQSVIAKIDRIPFEDIGLSVRDTSRAATSLLGRLDRDVVPKAQVLLMGADTAMAALSDGLKALRDNVAAPDSAIQQSTRAAIEQVERAAFSLRGLADYLKNHPEALVRGRASSSEPKSK